MEKRKVKKGDRLNATGDAYWVPKWQNVTATSDESAWGSIEVVNEAGIEGILSPDMWEFADRPATDQELADKYRKLRAEAASVGQQLIDRGYTVQGTDRSGSWVGISLNPYVQYRFTKAETVTKEL